MLRLVVRVTPVHNRGGDVRVEIRDLLELVEGAGVDIQKCVLEQKSVAALARLVRVEHVEGAFPDLHILEVIGCVLKLIAVAETPFLKLLLGLVDHRLGSFYSRDRQEVRTGVVPLITSCAKGESRAVKHPHADDGDDDHAPEHGDQDRSRV